MALRIRVPKLTLSPQERLLLRRAHLARVDLVRLDANKLVQATQGALPKPRAQELVASAQFQQLPNVGPSVAADLLRLGLRNLMDVKKADPDALLARLEKLAGRQDPCVGDVLQSAVWHARNPKSPERPWWEWSRQRLERKPARRKKR
ncbi:MAG: helix-hairpin-helix domain-containing protein [Myxococcales bacterium]